MHKSLLVKHKWYATIYRGGGTLIVSFWSEGEELAITGAFVEVQSQIFLKASLTFKHMYRWAKGLPYCAFFGAVFPC